MREPGLAIGDRGRGRVRARSATARSPISSGRQHHERPASTLSIRARSPIIGASDNPNKIGGRPLHLSVALRLSRGKVYPINPTRAEIQGVQELSAPRRPAGSARDGDRRGRRATAPSRRSTSAPRRGVKVAVVMASGFGESDPVGGEAAEQRMMRARPRKTGMRIVGPNISGPGEFRHRRDRELLDDVHRGAAAGRPGRDRQPERRDERRAVRPAAPARHRRAPHARDRQRCRRDGRGARDRGRRRIPTSSCCCSISKACRTRITWPRRRAIARERDLPILALKSGRTAAGAGGGAARTPARWRTRIASSMRSSSITASGA